MIGLISGSCQNLLFHVPPTLLKFIIHNAAELQGSFDESIGSFLIIFQTASTYNNFTSSCHPVLQVYPIAFSANSGFMCASMVKNSCVLGGVSWPWHAWCQPWMNQTQLINQEVTSHKKIPDDFDFELSWTFQMILHCLRELLLERFLEAAPIGNQQGHLPEWNPFMTLMLMISEWV